MANTNTNIFGSNFLDEYEYEYVRVTKMGEYEYEYEYLDSYSRI